MGIVAAGVHDAGRHSACGRGSNRARIGQARLLHDREPVHVGAKEDRGAIAVLHDRHHAGLADAFGHVEPKRPHSLRQLRRRLVFFEAEFGMGMEVAIELHQLGHVFVQRCAKVLSGSRCGARKCGTGQREHRFADVGHTEGDSYRMEHMEHGPGGGIAPAPTRPDWMRQTGRAN